MTKSSRTGLVWDSSKPNVISQKCTKGWKYAVSKMGFSSGVHFWNIFYSNTSEIKEMPISIGVATLPIKEEGMYTSKTKWLYSNGFILLRKLSPENRAKSIQKPFFLNLKPH